MSMYAFTLVEDGEVKAYAESTEEEEQLDLTEDGLAINFTGNGYLAFWKRCKQILAKVSDRSAKHRRAYITDLYSGQVKELA